MSLQREIMGGGVSPEVAKATVGSITKLGVATGTTQATALALGSAVNFITTVPAGSGVQLPPMLDSDFCIIFNKGANTLLVYPPLGFLIDSLAVNLPTSVPAGGMAEFWGSGSYNYTSAGLYAALAASSGSSLVGHLDNATGAVATNVSAYLNLMVKGLKRSFHAIGDGVADDTTAMANAFASGKIIEVESGTFISTAQSISSSSNLEIRGWGRESTFKFNTTGVGIDVNPGASAQARTFLCEGINFQQVTNVPAAFIRTTFTLNPIIEKCYFSGTAATYCIDNVSGYGFSIKDCVFSDITGGGYRQKEQGGANCNIEGTDFTRLSGSAIRIENKDSTTALLTLRVARTIIEYCATGIEVNKGAGGGNVQNIKLEQVYFEGNTGYSLDISPNGSGVPTLALLDACVCGTGTGSAPTMNLGTLGQLQANTCNNYNVVTVTGSGSASMLLLNSYQFIASGFSNVTDLGGIRSIQPVTFTPTITGVPTTSVAGLYYRVGHKVTVQIAVTVSGAATAVITCSLPFQDSGNTFNGVTIGSATATKNGVGYYVGAAWLDTVNHLVKFHSGTPGALDWINAVPFVWANADSFSATFEYFV